MQQNSSPKLTAERILKDSNYANLQTKKDSLIFEIERISVFLKTLIPESLENNTFVDYLLIKTNECVLAENFTVFDDRYTDGVLACLALEYQAKEILANKVFPESASISIYRIIKWLRNEIDKKPNNIHRVLNLKNDKIQGNRFLMQEHRLMKIVAVIIVLITVYLFATNNRYKYMEDGVVLDTWTKTSFYIERVLR